MHLNDTTRLAHTSFSAYVSSTTTTGIDGVKFRKPVVPGDTLVMEVELVKFMASFGIAKLKGKAYVDGDVAVEIKVR